MRKITTITLAVFMAAILFALASTIPAHAADVVKIGVVDMTRLVNESKKGKAAKAILMKKIEQVKKELELRQAEIEKGKLDLERQAAVLDADVRYEKEKSLKRKIRDFEDQYRDYTEVMKREEMNATKPILDELLKLIGEYGSENGYTIILENKRSGLVFHVNSIEITDDIIKLYDK